MGKTGQVKDSELAGAKVKDTKTVKPKAKESEAALAKEKAEETNLTGKTKARKAEKTGEAEKTQGEKAKPKKADDEKKAMKSKDDGNEKASASASTEDKADEKNKKGKTKTRKDEKTGEAEKSEGDVQKTISPKSEANTAQLDANHKRKEHLKPDGAHLSNPSNGPDSKRAKLEPPKDKRVNSGSTGSSPEKKRLKFDSSDGEAPENSGWDRNTYMVAQKMEYAVWNNHWASLNLVASNSSLTIWFLICATFKDIALHMITPWCRRMWKRSELSVSTPCQALTFWHLQQRHLHPARMGLWFNGEKGWMFSQAKD
jgi:hypothetical protein